MVLIDGQAETERHRVDNICYDEVDQSTLIKMLGKHYQSY